MKSIAAVLIYILAVVIGFAFWAWILMLLVGMAWHEFGILSPKGFYSMIPFGIIFTVIAGAFTSNNKIVRPNAFQNGVLKRIGARALDIRYSETNTETNDLGRLSDETD